MNFVKDISLGEIASKYACTIQVGDPNALVKGINEINRVRAGDICFVDASKYYKKTLRSDASFVIMPEVMDFEHDKAVLIHKNPFSVYNAIAKDEGEKHKLKKSFVDPSAQVADGVSISNNVHIGKDCIIEPQVHIGDNVRIGNNVKISAGTMIGTDAFYLHKSKEGKYTKWYSCGNVIIEDDVHIGANCTINQAVSDITKIGHGSQLDCGIHIAHGVQIGSDCLIAAQVGISGKTIIGNNVSIYGQVGITQNLVIGDNVIIYAQSGVNNNLAADGVYFGSPAIPIQDRLKEIRAVRRLLK